MSKKYKKDKMTLEEWGLATGCFIISFWFCLIFDLSGFLTSCIFVGLYAFFMSCKQKSKQNKLKEKNIRQESEKLFQLRNEEKIKQEMQKKEMKQEETRQQYESHPNQIALFDAKDYEDNIIFEEKNNQIEKELEEFEKEQKKDEKKVIPINKSDFYIFDYDNENEFKKLERSVKKYNMLAYKKLHFEFYPNLKDGKFLGNLVSINKKDKIEKYELQLPTDKMFSKIHGILTLCYTVYKKEKVIILNTITPEDILKDGHKDELISYKGVMLSKSHSSRDKFKIDLLNMISKD